MITFWLDIKPHPQERIRFKFRGFGKRRTITPYTPEKTKEFQDGIREMVRYYMAENIISEFPKGLPLSLYVTFYLARPASAKKRLAPTVRPDLSNYLKSLEDGLQRAARDDTPALIEDDSSICKIMCEKRYVDDEHPTPGILVEIKEWSPDENTAQLDCTEETIESKLESIYEPENTQLMYIGEDGDLETLDITAEELIVHLRGIK